MDANETKSWTGPKDGKEHKHILGQMRSETQASGRTVVLLEVYRNAIDMEAESPAQVDVAGIIFGEMYVRCNVDGCDYIGIWHAGNDVIRHLQARKKKEATYAAE